MCVSLQMASTPVVKLKWLEMLNSTWVGESCEVVASREATAGLYDRLLQNAEIAAVPQQVGRLGILEIASSGKSRSCYLRQLSVMV